MKVLLDHHMKKQGILLWATIDSSDREVWRFAQKNQLILLTGNRNNEGEDSLEQTIRDENKSTSLPVITIGALDRMEERTYREECAERLVDIILNLEGYLGLGRIYIP